MTAITDPNHIAAFRMLSLLAGLRLEVRGMRTRGRSCYQIVKAEYGMTGNRRQVLEKYEAHLIEIGVKREKTQ